MATLALLSKDIHEHRAAALLLALGSLLVVFILLAQNSAAAYSMSAFEIVRFALVSFIPLVALIVGNRLIVNEYISGTRLFVEALPVGTFKPLFLKYILGFGYVVFIATAIVALAAEKAVLADDVTAHYMLLILVKTWVMVALYWSIVFCFSLFGFLRIALYMITIGMVLLIRSHPAIDASAFAPMGLMDSQLFVYERDLVPQTEIVVTLSLALMFTVAGFMLTRLSEGSVVERLAKPMTRRDYVALSVLLATGVSLGATLLDDNQRDPIDFSNANVIKLKDPDVSIMYLDPLYRSPAEQLGMTLSDSLAQLQSALAITRLPTVRLVLTPSREKYDLDYSTSDGVFISANWLEHDSYDDAILLSVVMHGVLSYITNGRSVFEPTHWILDGFTRWWVEQGNAPITPSHRDELVARALLTLDREPRAAQLIERWQLTADQFAYPSAEALAWAAMAYLESMAGRERVIMLGSEFLTSPVGTSVVASWEGRPSRVRERIESIIGMSLSEFHAGWQGWLEQQRNEPGVQAFFDSVPALVGVVQTRTDSSGVRYLEGAYIEAPDSAIGSRNMADIAGQCIMKHDYIGPFDTEFDVSDDDADYADCVPGEVVHSIGSTYGSGDRVYVGLDHEGSLFHQAVRLGSQRILIP